MGHAHSNSLTSRPNSRRPAPLVCQPLVTNLYIPFTGNQRVYRIKPRGAPSELSLGRDSGSNPAEIPQGRYPNQRHFRRLTLQPKSNHRRASALDRIHPSFHSMKKLKRPSLLAIALVLGCCIGAAAQIGEPPDHHDPSTLADEKIVELSNRFSNSAPARPLRSLAGPTGS